MKRNNYITLANKAAFTQINELKKIKKIFNKSFVRAVDLILGCKGKVICAGIGKSGLIARKISATFSSVGIPSFFCDPAQALHGDMGQIEKKDILIIFSYSGNTVELTNMLKYANRYRIKIIGIASKPESILLKASDVKILLPPVLEADPTRMVPTSSTSITLLFGDTLAIALMHKLKFSKDRFKVFHPGGNIGKNLLAVKDIMISGKKMPTIHLNKNMNEAIKIINSKKLGLVVVLKKNLIQGIITDGDARRSMRHYKKENSINKIMTKNPLTIEEDLPATKALSIMNDKKITSLLVVKKRNKGKKLAGIVHIHSLLEFGIK